MLASVAVAAETPSIVADSQYGDASPISSILPMLLIALVFYVLIIRPNQNKIKSHENMVKDLRRGDKVVTGGGVIGTVIKIEDDNIVVVEIAPEVKIKVIRDTISNVISKAPIANDNKADSKK
ncbi:MAG: preprotein translocase subunit YajC [Pseudomonadota bacterium]